MGHWEDSGKSDEWYTPKYIFDALGCRFDTDAASPKDFSLTHVPANNFIFEDSLNKEWVGFTWLNPPFGKRNSKNLWLNKMHEHGNGLVLTPDRTSAPWFQEALKKSDACLFVDGKVQFIAGHGNVSNVKQPSTGTCIFAYGWKGMEVLLNAQENKLGVCLELYKEVNYKLY